MMHGQLQPGDLIYGDYQVMDLAGVGATSHVYRCRPRSANLPEEVAVKVLHNRFVYDAQARGRFLREAALMQELNHQNIVSLFDVIEAPGQVAFVMEHVNGPTLHDWQGNNPGPRADRELCDVFIDILNGLGYAHRRGIIHRDLKPANILLDYTGERPVAKIIDFGVARRADTPPPADELRTIRGTAAYISPDEIRSPYEVCEASDLYSLGVILYELAAGTRPFHGGSPNDLLHAHLSKPPVPPSVFNPNIPPELEQVILRTLAKHPAQRFTDASSLQTALEQALHIAWEIRTEQWARPTLPPPSPELRALAQPSMPQQMLQLLMLLMMVVLNPGTTRRDDDPHYLARPHVELPGLV